MNKRMLSEIHASCILKEKKMDFKEIQIIVSILTAITTSILSFFGYLISKWNKKKTQLDVIKEYYKEGDSKELVQIRKNLLNLYDNNNAILSNEFDEDAAFVCNFFNKWSMMVRYGNLPFYIFKGASGHGVRKIYNVLKRYIEKRRKDNPLYANDFEYLYNKIKNYNQKRSKRKWYFLWLKQ
ncbi:DUF4760 domain-containing protein [Cohnella endophytica]|uniref:DUF4760 domain-containing protein n=1 Tax=Cohnella endophytica TaxID=2419778 RepID=UPI0011C38074|nr:hypothetical protein [Cohnella endophytica]